MSLAAPSHLLPPAPHPQSPPPGTALPMHYSGCFACGELACGLRLRFTTGEGVSVHGVFQVDPRHQGAPGLAHGGLIAAAFDEALGALQVFTREPAVTASLQTEFRRPVPVGTTLHLMCRLDGRDGRKLWVSGDAHLDDPDGPIAAQATALFLTVPLDHFARHGRTAEVEAAKSELRGRREVNP
ncbi:PaaI family thioesterase [Pseudonocardia sp. GCM10023141]|uniref:PaaI family thioesterase n=1 Tax=Pseudonocardia sp. GCM10023141 TaxID=3252653 RepID=UPI00361FBA85